MKYKSNKDRVSDHTLSWISLGPWEVSLEEVTGAMAVEEWTRTTLCPRVRATVPLEGVRVREGETAEAMGATAGMRATLEEATVATQCGATPESPPVWIATPTTPMEADLMLAL